MSEAENRARQWVSKNGGDDKSYIAGWDAAMRQMQDPMECGHPRACFVERACGYQELPVCLVCEAIAKAREESTLETRLDEARIHQKLNFSKVRGPEGCCSAHRIAKLEKQSSRLREGK